MTKFQSCLDLIKCKGTFYGSKVGDGTKGVDGGGGRYIVHWNWEINYIQHGGGMITGICCIEGDHRLEGFHHKI